MADQNSTRKLAAIVFADVVGYTALMQADETEARRKLAQFRNTIDDQITRHRGQVMQFYGDGCLCTFDSSVDAVNFGQSIQLVFRGDPGVPVRIGIHSDDVVFEADNVFGDGVNLASRIESTGVAGSVLLSGRVRDEIKNHPELEVTSLGRFRFKNVASPIEVFALKNDQLVTPLAGDLQKHAASQSSVRNAPKRKTLLGLAAATILLIGMWAVINSGKKNGNTDGSTLSSLQRDQRVAVLEFENQTLDTELTAYGKMISDWITKGLMETGSASVVTAGNLLDDVQLAGAASVFENKASTEIGVLIDGRYYLNEDALIIHVNIREAVSGQFISSTQVSGSRSDVMKLLDDFTQEVLGHWAVQGIKRFQQNPPKYEAYQELIKADPILLSDPREAARHLQQAFELDTTFYYPLLKLIALMTNHPGQDSTKNALFQYITDHQANLSSWEAQVFHSLKASEENDWKTAARICEDLYVMDISDAATNYNSGTFYIYDRQPEKGLSVLQDFNHEIYVTDGMQLSWRSATKSFALFWLKRYTEIGELARNYHFPKMSSALGVIHLKSLIQMDSMARFIEQHEEYMLDGLYDFDGSKESVERVLSMICDELQLVGDETLLKRYAKRLEQATLANPDFPQHLRYLGMSYYYRRDYASALKTWQREEIPRSWFGQIDYYSRLGSAYALTGDSASAAAQIDNILNITAIFTDLPAYQDYYHARILAALGQKSEAIDMLQKAYHGGVPFYRPQGYWQDPLLFPLVDEPAFEEFMEPQG